MAISAFQNFREPDHLNESAWHDFSYRKHMLVSGYTLFKYARFSVTLILNDFLHQIDALIKAIFSCFSLNWEEKWSWWNRIELPNSQKKAALYLGSLPIEKSIGPWVIRNDLDVIKKLGVKAILSVTEPFETNSRVLHMKGITHDQWAMDDVSQHQLSTEDFNVIALHKIQQGVEFIQWHISRNSSVYVHCKAGLGRSALITLCFLMKYYDMSAEEAYESLKKNRPQVNLNQEQWFAAKRYEAIIVAANILD